MLFQESVRNSSDGMLLSAPDSLVVSIVKTNSLDGDEHSNLVKPPSTPHKSSAHGFGMDGLDSLKFTYKVFPQRVFNLFLCLVSYSELHLMCSNLI